MLLAGPGCRSNVNDNDLVLTLTLLASRAPDGTQGNLGSFTTFNGQTAVAISGDGRRVAFTSAATTLHPDDPDVGNDVFVRDFQTDAVTLVSRATGAAGAKANNNCSIGAISADGRYVAFQASATNLDPDDADFFSDIYLRDLESGTTTLCSRATGVAGAKLAAQSTNPTVSDDGRYVAFVSAAALDPADVDALTDAYVRDVQTSTTYLVSVNTAGAKSDGATDSVRISADGLRVVFDTLGANLDPADVDGNPDVYSRDWQSGTPTTTLVSVSTGGAKGNGQSTRPSPSRDGRHVAFESTSTNLHVVPLAVRCIYVRDLALGTTTLASVHVAGTQPTGASGAAAISRDGGHVVFSSLAGNLVPGDTNIVLDVFRRDLAAGTTVRVSVATYGGEVDTASDSPSISSDGRYVAFHSGSGLLVDGDRNGKFDVFRRGPLE